MFRRLTSLMRGRGERTFPAQVTSVDDLLSRYGGQSFARSAYRVADVTEVGPWNARVVDAFPEFAGRISCFGYDWLGRAFALDAARLEPDGAGVCMFEPGTGEALEIPCGLIGFHERELVEESDAVLAIDFHGSWLARGGAEPGLQQCVGYRVPLYLGGADDVENLEVVDLDVYWTLSAQMLGQVRDLPPGTPIGGVSIS